MLMNNLKVSVATFIYKIGTRFFGRKGLHRVWPFGVVYDWVSLKLHAHEWPEHIVIDGHTIYAHPSLRPGLMLFKNSAQDFDFQLFKKEVPHGGTVLDIGANVGFYSIFFARYVGNNGKVFAFEPEPQNLSFLRKNVSENRYTNVEIVPKAVGAKEGEVELFVSDFNSGGHQIYDMRGSILAKGSLDLGDRELLEDEHSDAPRKSLKVGLISLDNFLADYPKPIDFVKMDVEGAEGGVLAGMTRILRENKHIKLHFEFSPACMRIFGTDPREFLATLEREGFVFYDLVNFRIRKNKMELVTGKELLARCPHNQSTDVFARRA